MPRKKTPITILYENRLLKSEKEVAAFEQAMEEIGDSPHTVDLKELFLVFTDACQHQEVMWGLLHLVESFEEKLGLEALVEVLPAMLNDAFEWAKIIHCRILNHEESRKHYKDFLSALPKAKRAPVETMFQRIRDKDPDFGPAIDYVLS